MTCENCPPIIEQYGANPKTMQWNVVRGDTSSLRIEFLEDDEVTAIDTSDWTFAATAYDTTDGVSYTLTVTPENGYVDILATPEQTENWGTGFRTVVDELAFDLEVTTGDIVWTPVIGTICVYGDVTTGGSL
jgi:hypothetical protein